MGLGSLNEISVPLSLSLSLYLSLCVSLSLCLSLSLSLSLCLSISESLSLSLCEHILFANTYDTHDNLAVIDFTHMPT